MHCHCNSIYSISSCWRYNLNCKSQICIWIFRGMIWPIWGMIWTYVIQCFLRSVTISSTLYCFDHPSTRILVCTMDLSLSTQFLLSCFEKNKTALSHFSTMAHVINQYQWIPVSISGCICMFIQIYILKLEFRIRQKVDRIFNSSFAKISPIFTIICGVIYSFFWFIRYFQFVCHVSIQIIFIFAAGIGISTGLYQLSRLYYCFAQTKTHHNIGYPKYMFILMYIIALD